MLTQNTSSCLANDLAFGARHRYPIFHSKTSRKAQKFSFAPWAPRQMVDFFLQDAPKTCQFFKVLVVLPPPPHLEKFLWPPMVIRVIWTEGDIKIHPSTIVARQSTATTLFVKTDLDNYKLGFYDRFFTLLES